MSTLHERLLAEPGIWVAEARSDWIGAVEVLSGAVRAVVEMHAPEFFGGVIACLACSPGMPPQVLIAAPCPTITAIAEALGIGETP